MGASSSKGSANRFRCLRAGGYSAVRQQSERLLPPARLPWRASRRGAFGQQISYDEPFAWCELPRESIGGWFGGAGDRRGGARMLVRIVDERRHRRCCWRKHGNGWKQHRRQRWPRRGWRDRGRQRRGDRRGWRGRKGRRRCSGRRLNRLGRRNRRGRRWRRERRRWRCNWRERGRRRRQRRRHRQGRQRRRRWQWRRRRQGRQWRRGHLWQQRRAARDRPGGALRERRDVALARSGQHHEPERLGVQPRDRAARDAAGLVAHAATRRSSATSGSTPTSSSTPPAR